MMQAIMNPENTSFSMKTFIERTYEEDKQVSYKVVRYENGNVKLDCYADGKHFSPEESVFWYNLLVCLLFLVFAFKKETSPMMPKIYT